MPLWTVSLRGKPSIFLRGNEVQLRLSASKSLALYLIVRGTDGATREELAGELWPNHSENARVYLRRAAKELVDAGFPIWSNRERLGINFSKITHDWPTTGGVISPETWLESIPGQWVSEARKSIAVEPTPTTIETADFLDEFWKYVWKQNPKVLASFLASYHRTTLGPNVHEDLLEVCRDLLQKLDPLSVDRAKIQLLAGRLARIKTQHLLGERLLLEGIDFHVCKEDVRLAIEFADELSFLYLVTRQWREADRWAGYAFRLAESASDRVGMAIAFDAIGRALWQVGNYEPAAKAYLRAFGQETDTGRRVAIAANLSFIRWMNATETVVPEINEKDTFINDYTRAAFCFGRYARCIGAGDPKGAAAAITESLKLVVKNEMERFVLLSLDAAAICLYQLGEPHFATAILRRCMTLRLHIQHQHAPMEKDAIRRHAPGPYFGKEHQRHYQTLKNLEAGEIATLAIRRIRTYM